MRVIAKILMILMVPCHVAAQAQKSGTYVLEQRGQRIATEEFSFDGSTLTTEFHFLPANMTMSNTVRLNEDLHLVGTELIVTREPGGQVVQELTVTVEDSLSWTLVGGPNAGSGTIAAPENVTFYANPLATHLALMIYRAVANGTMSFNAWMGPGQAAVPVLVTVSGDTASLSLAGVGVIATFDDEGWLRTLSVPSQGVEGRYMADEDAEPVGRRRPIQVPEGIVESSLEFPSDELVLQGTLTLPEGSATASTGTVIVAGSGPTDRDGNSAAGLWTDTYRQLAWGLAQAGIPSLRFDKRVLAPGFDPTAMEELTLSEFAADVGAAVRALHDRLDLRTVVVVGHSEGGLLALLAARSEALIDGLVLVSTPGRNAATVVREQLAGQLDSVALERYERAMEVYLSGGVPEVPEGLEGLFHPANREFTRSLFRFDPADSAADIDLPVLVVQGDMDIQVGEVDARALHAALPSSELLILRGMTHTLKQAQTRERSAQVKHYSDPSLPLAPGLTDSVVSWIRRRIG